MCELTQGCLDEIMRGIEVDKPVIQILGHKKLSSTTTSTSERYRLLLSDGQRTNSFAMLATQLNSLITDNILTDFSICEIGRYAMSTVNNGGTQKRVMVILNINVKVPGHKVGHKIGNPTNVESSADSESTSSRPALGPSVAETKAAPQNKTTTNHTAPSGIMTMPLNVLTPYVSRWVIKVRIVGKSAIRTWSNSRGEGKLFSMDLMDETSEIRCTAFREQCDKFYDMIEVGKVYYISRCQVKPANKQFNHLKNDYELTMTNDTEVVLCLEDIEDIPQIKFNFCPIIEMDNKETGQVLDVLGVLKHSHDVQTFTARTTGRELKKRDITIFDESNTAVNVSLWGGDAEGFDCKEEQIIAIKGVRIGEFNGAKNLSTIGSSVIQIDPDIPEAHKLRGWYNTAGRSQEIKTLSKFTVGAGGGGPTGPLLTFKEASRLPLVDANDSKSYQVKARINLIRSENAVYKACPTDGCNKKVVDQDNQMYRCEKCGREYPNFKYRLLLNINFCDWSGHIWATAFNEVAEKLLGATASEIGELMTTDTEAYNAKFHQAAFSEYMLRMRVKKDIFGDAIRHRTICNGATTVDYISMCESYLNSIKEMANIGTV